MKRYVLVLFLSACGAAEELPAEPELINGYYEAESLCKAWEQAFCEAHRRCSDGVPNCTMKCYRFSGVTHITTQEMDRCADSLDFDSCSSLMNDQFTPTTCSEVTVELYRHQEA